MHHLILAAINPDNTPGGYQWTYLFPMLLFIVIALILWALFGRPHQRVPSRRITLGLSSAGGRSAAAATTAAASAVAPASDAPLAASAEPEPAADAADAADAEGGQPADGAGAGE